jgi:hypothetical protein
MPDLYLPPKRTFGAHLIAGIHRSPSKVGAVWNAHNCIIHGDGCPRSHYKPDTGTRIVGPDPNEGDMPPALLTLQGIGVTVRDLGFCGAYPIPTGSPPVADLPIGLAVKLISGTGKMHWSHLDFRWLKTGVEIGGDSANSNCDQITGEQLYFHDCGTAFKTGHSHSQAMAFLLGQVEINGCGIGFDMTGSNLSVGMVVVLATEIVLVCRRDNPSVSDEIHKLVMDAQPPGKRTVLFSQPKPGRSCTTFHHVTWPKGHSADHGQPMIQTNNMARVVVADSILPAENLVSTNGGDVLFRDCGFWPGWSPEKAFPISQRNGKYRVVFRNCRDTMTLKPFDDPNIVIKNP